MDHKKLLFTEARSFNKWQDKQVTNEQLHELYDLMKFGPTAANSCPARIVFAKTDRSRQRLARFMDPGNQRKVLEAPVTAIIATSLNFYDKLPRLFPHTDARSWFTDTETSDATARRNSSLQGAYFIMAARSMGLDCGPMSGFNEAAVANEFHEELLRGDDLLIEINFVCSIGYGDRSSLHPRSPRLPFDEACIIT